MNRKEWQKIVMALLIIVILGIVSVYTIKFNQKKENINIENKTQNNEIVFSNDSSASEEEIRNLVETKREQLKDFFLNIQYYKASEVSQEHTLEDDEQYIVLDFNFWEKFKNLVTSDIYKQYLDRFEVVKKKEDINIHEELYIGSKNVFNNIYLESAIATIDVTEELLVLSTATDNKITTYENIRYYNEEDICIRNDFYSFNLQKENEEWKVSEFTQKRK